MKVTVRFSVDLANVLGQPRLTVALNNDATVADLLDYLKQEYPALQQKLGNAAPIIAGQHAPLSKHLSPDQEVALLLPIAGG